MKVTILYFAAVRDLTGIAEETIDVPTDVTTIERLRAHLATLHPTLDGRLGPVRFAKNEEFAAPNEAVDDGDVVALIPPVAGG